MVRMEFKGKPEATPTSGMRGMVLEIRKASRLLILLRKYCIQEGLGFRVEQQPLVLLTGMDNCLRPCCAMPCQHPKP